MPLLPSKARTVHKHTENKENIEGGLDRRSDQATHSHTGTSRHAFLATNQSDTPQCAPTGRAEDANSKNKLKRRQARRQRRMAVIFLPN